VSYCVVLCRIVSPWTPFTPAPDPAGVRILRDLRIELCRLRFGAFAPVMLVNYRRHAV
jgi:hypothetical protein